MNRFRENTRAGGPLIYPVMLLLLILVFLGSICIGRYPIHPGHVFLSFAGALTGRDYGLSMEEMTIILHVRLPRCLVGGLVGAALAASGCAFQGLFRNPLVSQGILGVSSGSAFGAALSILLFTGTFYTPLFSFAFGVLAVLLTFMVARVCNGLTTVMLVLGGTIISNLFSALLSLVKYMADPTNQLASITFWNMGSLASLQESQFPYSVAAMAVGMILLLLCAWMINVLSISDAEAKTMGLPVEQAKILVVLGATLCTAGAVSITGNIGWVGLIIPHAARFMIGSDNRKLIPLSMLMGAAFLMLVDLLCRTISGAEIPLGIMTSLIGGPFFIYLLRKFKGGNWR